MQPATSLYDLDRAELVVTAARYGASRAAAERLFRSLHRDGAVSFGGIDGLADEFTIDPLAPVRRTRSKDGSTEKTLFRLSDGEQIETVLMRYDPDSHRRGRNTVCVSTQAGCAFGCTFCATGQQGLRRQLGVGEIVGQVVSVARSSGATVTNVVFMGMGEPFADYDRTMKAIRILGDGRGQHIGPRHITVSTVGLVPEILRFAEEPLPLNLAVSLHAPDDATRTRLLPVNRRYPLRGLLDACRAYIAKSKRRIFFEYVLMAAVNDALGQAHELGALLKGMFCRVNLIPVNRTGAGPFGRPTDERVGAFQSVLAGHGVPTTVRSERGVAIAAGCGQLRSRNGV